MRLERGDVWLFSDGREGVVASSNAIGTTFYIGPQAITVPSGDLVLVMDRATRVAAPPAPLPAEEKPSSGRGKRERKPKV